MIVKPNFPEHFSYLVLDIADHHLENIIAHLPRVCCSGVSASMLTVVRGFEISPRF
jgi:hypothetical protein